MFLCVLIFIMALAQNWAYNIKDLKDLCGIPSDSNNIRSTTCQTSISAADYPWQVSIVGRDGVHWCTGTLITDRHVLSSAHCFFHEACGTKCKIQSVSLYELHFGRSNRTDFINPRTKQRSDIPDHVDVVRNIADIFIPPDFDARDAVISGNDIAIILIDEPIQFRKEILPACLPSSESKDIFDIGGVGYIAGFSHIRSGNEIPLTLQAFRMDIVPASNCARNLLVFGYDAQDAPDTICSKSTFRCSRSKESSICKGDSGGPLMSTFTNRNGVSQWIVGGVHAFGEKLCGKSKTNIPIYFTRVSEYLEFINRIINIDQAATTPLTTPSVSTTTQISFTQKPKVQSSPNKRLKPKFPLPSEKANFKCTDSEEGYICRYLTDGKLNNEVENNLVCGSTKEGYSCIFKTSKTSRNTSSDKKIPAKPLRKAFQTKLSFNSRPNSARATTTTTKTTVPSPAASGRSFLINRGRVPNFIKPAQRKKIRIQGTYRLLESK